MSGGAAAREEKTNGDLDGLYSELFQRALHRTCMRKTNNMGSDNIRKWLRTKDRPEKSQGPNNRKRQYYEPTLSLELTNSAKRVEIRSNRLFSAF
jgi:hypothetical protein